MAAQGNYYTVLPTLNPLICDCEPSIYLDRLSFFSAILFFQVQIFLMFTPKCFILFGATLNGIFFLILFAVCLLLAYKKKIHFYIDFLCS